MTVEPQLFELHDLARERGIEGYRRLSKAELVEAIGELPSARPDRGSRTECRRDGLAVLTLRGPGGENALALETIEQLADEAERLAGDQSTCALSPSPARAAASSAPAPTWRAYASCAGRR